MKTVILYGDQKENEMDSAFIDILLPYTNLLYVSEKYIVKKQSDSKENTLIISCDKVPQIKNMQGVFIFKNSFCNFETSCFPDNFIPIFDSHNLKAANILKNIKRTAISCGNSKKSTFSLSGIKENIATVSLQRYISTIDSNTVEPLDTCIFFNDNYDINCILSAAAALFLLDLKNK